MSPRDEVVEKINELLRKKYGNADMSSQRKLFDAHDRDDDGTISFDELMGLLEEADVGNRLTRRAWCRGIIRHMDEGDDGTISWKEYHQAVGG